MSRSTKRITDYLNGTNNDFQESFVKLCDDYLNDNYQNMSDIEVKYVASEINGNFMENIDLKLEDYLTIVNHALIDIRLGDYVIKYL